jgi:hypothetical protein
MTFYPVSFSHFDMIISKHTDTYIVYWQYCGALCTWVGHWTHPHLIKLDKPRWLGSILFLCVCFLLWAVRWSRIESRICRGHPHVIFSSSSPVKPQPLCIMHFAATVFGIWRIPDARFEALTALRIQVEVFWDVTPFSVAVGFHAAFIFGSPWRWRQHGLPKLWYPNTKLHSVTTHNNGSLIVSSINIFG